MKKSLSRNQKSNLRLYMTYFIRFAVLLIALSSVFQIVYFGYTLRHNIGENSVATLSLLRKAHEAVLNQVDKSTTSLFTDPFYSNYMEYYKKQNYNILNSIYDSLKNIVESNQSIRTVCIYYREDDYTLSYDMGPAPTHDYHDSDFLLQLNDMNIRYTYTTTRQVKYPKSKEEESVITLIRTLPIYYNTKHPYAYVIIDLDKDYIDNTLRSLAGEDTSIIVADKDGRILAQTKVAKDIEFDKVVQNEHISDAYSIQKINGQRMVASYTQSDVNGWQYLILIPLSRYINIGMWVFAFVAISVLCFILCIPRALKLSRKIYHPIYNIAQLFNEDNSDVQTLETDRILNGINRILDENAALIKDRDAGIGTELETQFARLLTGNIDKNDVDIILQKTLLQYTTHETKLLLLVKTDRFDIIDRQLADCMIFTAHMSMHSKVYIIRTLSAENEIVQINMPENTLVGISLPFEAPDDIAEAYRQALTAIDMKLVKPESKYFLYDNSMAYGNVNYPLDCEIEILKAIRDHIEPQVKIGLEQFSRKVLHGSPNPNSIRNCYMQLYCAMMRLAYEASTEPHQLLHDFNYQTLLSLSSIEDMNDYLFKMYRRVEEDTRKADNQSTEIVDKICIYIANNLDEDLSLERLSENFGISTSSMRKLFQITKGTTIKNYIDICRIDLAKKLLADGVKLQDIATKIGFMSSQAFSRFFKNSVGLTPGEYRSYVKSKNNESHIM